MRLLDRYLLRELLLPLGYCLSGFLIFWIGFDLFSEVDDYQEAGMTALDIAEYYLVMTPDYLFTVLPVAFLLGLLYALTNHARHNEITAIRSAGVSLWRLSAPYLFLGIFFSVGLFAINDIWLPDAAERAEAILKRRLPEQEQQPDQGWHRNLNFRNDRDQRIWNIGAYHVEAYEMRNILVEWRLPDGARRQFFAERGSWKDGHWHFQNVVQFTYTSNEDPVPEREQMAEMLAEELRETPEQIKSEIKISGMSSFAAAKRVVLSVPEILNYLRLHPDLRGSNRAMLLTQLHGRLAAPWTCLVVVLIAIPFGAASGRRNVFVGVASSVFICFTYFVLSRLGLALGTSGHVAPWLAAWFPNIFFGSIGIWLTSRVR